MIHNLRPKEKERRRKKIAKATGINPENTKQLIQLAKLVTTYQSTLHIINVTLRSSYPKMGRSWRDGFNLVMETSHFDDRVGRITPPLAVRKSRVVNKVLHKSPCDTIVYKSRGDLAELEKLMIPSGRPSKYLG